MAEATQLLPITGCDNPTRQADVIFVHGLDGDAHTTWHPKDKPTHFWPAWLGEDILQLGVWSLDYAVHASAWRGHSMPLYDRADNVLDLFGIEGIGQRPVAFVCHSLGGLLIKQVLRNARDADNAAWQAIADHTRLVVFLSTPHSGANLANWTNYLHTLLRTTVSVDELEAHHPRLRELNDWYRDHVASLGIDTFVYYETRPTAGILVVDPTTANPGITGVRSIAVDEDHRSICKPDTKNHRIYRRVKRQIEQMVGRSGSATPPAAEPYQRYYQTSVARWADDARYALDKRFVRLTLLLDQGEETQGMRWQPAREQFQDLEEVLAQVPEQAVVVLGPPGSGKSTLLRHYELERAQSVLDSRAEGTMDTAPLTFFLPLNDYPAGRQDELRPEAWLAERWAAAHPDLPPLDTLLRAQRLILLLDALNEMPRAGAAPLQAWKDFLRLLARDYPGNRVIFSCRSLDYSASLSSTELPVPQVRIEPLSDAQVQEFLERYCPAHASTLWANLAEAPQLALLRLPYYLHMLVKQTVAGEIPAGRAALFTGFVRLALKREVDANHPLFSADGLLTARDLARLTHGRWRTPYELPGRGVLFDRLSTLAFAMQAQRADGEAGQVRADYDAALDLLDHERAEDILKAGEALGILEQDLGSEEVLYVHQLMQEYFAARRLAATPEPERVQVAWQAEQVAPSLPETLASLADTDPLPPLPSTGWEETTVLAAAMADDPERFVIEVMAHNLALAGRCAAQPEGAVSEALRERLRWALVERTQDAAADLRARIAAGLTLGELGDPRLERRQGPHGAYLLPPLIEIPGGTYRIGSEEGLYEDEAPMHSVELPAFAMAQFPITNAEWALFMQAGGYEEERWWETEAARAWRQGDTAEGPKRDRREFRKQVQENFDRIRELHRENRITSKQAEDWEAIARMDDEAFEEVLNEWYPGGRQTQPASWHDDTLNNPAQPVVGICWFEARAYCAWLSTQTVQTFRLPTEAEWEAAARGLQGRRYAWGDDFDAARCNTFETHIRRTTPIGVFPGGATPEGLIDMTGNTWDWTSSLYQPYPYDAADGREDPTVPAASRVLRGGAWSSNPVYARATYRDYLAPGPHYDLIGLRLVQSSPILP